MALPSAEPPITVSIDADPTGNTATSLESTEACRTVALGQDSTVDIVMRRAQGLLYFECDLLYDERIVNILDVQVGARPEEQASRFPFLASAAGSVINLSDSGFPDADGRIHIGALDLSRTGPSGQGVLARLSLRPVREGHSDFRFGDGGTFWNPVAARFGARIIVGGQCTDADSDGVPDSQEAELGSNPADAQSQPERPGFPPAPGSPSDRDACTDHADNDNDGLVDADDPGCRQPEPTPSRFLKVIAEGDPSPVGGAFAALGGVPPRLVDFSDGKEVLFWSGILGGRSPSGLFLFSDGDVASVVATGDSSPVGGSFAEIPPLVAVDLNDRFEVAFPAAVSGGTSPFGLFLWSGGFSRAVVSVGDQAPIPALVDPRDLPDEFLEVGGEPSLDDKGQVAFFATQGKLGQGRTGLYIFTAGTVRRLATSGDATPLGRLNLFLGGVLGPFLNDLGDLAFLASTDQASEAIFLLTPGAGIRRVVTVGDPVPGGAWPFHGGPCCLAGINDGPQVALLPSLSPGGDILLWSPGGFERVVAGGDASPIGGMLGQVFPGRLLPSDGSVVFSAGVLGGANSGGLWRWSQGRISQVSIEGEASPIGGTFLTVEQGSSAGNERGAIAVDAAVSGGRSPSAILLGDGPRLQVRAIQSVFHSRPQGRFQLVAGKDLVLRAFYQPTVATSAEASGELCVDPDGDACPQERRFVAQGFVYPPTHQFSLDDRRYACNSINFFVTGEDANRLLTPGSHRFRITIRPVTEGEFEEAGATVEGGFQEQKSMAVFFVPVEVSGFGSPTLPQTLDSLTTFLKATYPLDEERIVACRWFKLSRSEAPIGITSDVDASKKKDLVLALSRIQLTLVALGGRGLCPADLTYVAGIVPDLAMNVGGYTFASPKGTVVASDRAGTIRKTLAHEIGHTLGLGEEYSPAPDRHYDIANPPPYPLPPGTSPFGDEKGNYILESMEAFDVGSRRALFSVVVATVNEPLYGFMGKATERFSWVTDVEYRHLYRRLARPGGAGGGLQQLAVVSGTVHVAGSGALGPLIVLESSAEPSSEEAGRYALEFRGAGGEVLRRFGFDADFTMEAFGEEEEARRVNVEGAPFAFLVELPEEARSLHLLDEERELAVRLRSLQPPSVSIGSARLEEDGALLVAWEASDPDQDPLTFLLVYSPDGVTSVPVAVDLADTSYRIPLEGAATAPGPGAFVLVRAYDGFNAAEETAFVEGSFRFRRVPGDCNQDRRLDISDAVCVFGFLFLGSPRELPCGDGSARHAGNLALMDWQPDGGVDISDGIALLNFLFSGGPPHPSGTGCVAMEGCPALCTP